MLLYQNDILALLFSQLFVRYASAVPGHSTMTVRQVAILFFLEYERNRFVYRAHPLYRGESSYYDWANVQWVVSQTPVTNTVIHKPYVARILRTLSTASFLSFFTRPRHAPSSHTAAPLPSMIFFGG